MRADTPALPVLLLCLWACARNEFANTDQAKDKPRTIEIVGPKDRVLPENVKQIKRGMPMRRVEQILGEPSPQSAHDYLDREHGIRCIEEISFGPNWAGDKVWIGTDLDIVVSYDNVGFVISTVTFSRTQRKRFPLPVDADQKTP